MANRFPELLAAYLRRRGGMSAEALGDRSDVPQSTMSRIARGQRLPDLDKLDQWAEILELDGAERDDFILSGQLAHCPQPIRDLIDRMDAERDALEKRLDAVELALQMAMKR